MILNYKKLMKEILFGANSVGTWRKKSLNTRWHHKSKYALFKDHNFELRQHNVKIFSFLLIGRCFCFCFGFTTRHLIGKCFIIICLPSRSST